MEKTVYVRIDSYQELRAWFLLMFSEPILTRDIDLQNQLARKLDFGYQFMISALNTCCDCKFDVTFQDDIILSL